MSLKIIFVFTFFVVCSLNARAQTATATPPVTIPPITIPQMQSVVAVNDANVKEIEAALKKNPGNSNQRENIIDYYAAKTDAESAKALHRHRLLFIRHSPEAFFLTELGNWSAGDKENPEYVELRNEWFKQVAADKKNSRIRSNAVQFVAEVEPDEAEKLLREGIEVDPEDGEFSRELLTLLEKNVLGLSYGYDSNETIVTLNEIDDANKKLIREIENRLAAYEKNESEKFGGDRFVMLIRAAKTHLEIGDWQKAKIAAEIIARDYGDEGEGVRDEREVTFYSNTLLGRAALREGNIGQAKEHLLKAAALPEDGEWKIPAGELDLPAELLGKGENQIVLEYLKLAQKWADEKALATFRRWERKLSRNLSPLADEAEDN